MATLDFERTMHMGGLIVVELSYDVDTPNEAWMNNPAWGNRCCRLVNRTGDKQLEVICRNHDGSTTVLPVTAPQSERTYNANQLKAQTGYAGRAEFDTYEVRTRS